MGAHTGRCFRALRRTKRRHKTQGRAYLPPIRHKVPLALRSFMTHGGMRATLDTLGNAIRLHTAHLTRVRRGAARGQ